MSQYYPTDVPAFVNFNVCALESAARSGYAAPYYNPGPVPSAFPVGSSLGADHLEHLQCPPRYFHARGARLGAQSTGTAQYSSASSSVPPPRYATGVPISGYGATPAFSSRPAGRTWDRDAPASADDVQGLAVHGHAVHGHASEALLPLRYSAAAAASFSAPSPVVSSSSCSIGLGSGVYKRGEGVVLASPTPQVPIHSQMAILLNDRAEHQHAHDSRGDNARPRAFDNIRRPVAYALRYPDSSEPATERELEDDANAIEEGFLSRDKKHGCTMCHKRFDRPSTLKKHLLVHTGEKAFQCSICERRFGVMSNLNRHIRRCSLREVHTHGAAASALPTSLAEKRAPVVTGKRARSPPASNSTDGATAPAPAPRKRRRRPPSPTRWIPASLRSFNILAPEVTPAARVPLKPVSPRRARAAYSRPGSDVGSDDGPEWDEERDSYNENVGRAPYHPSDWDKTHRLPGPLPDLVKFGGAIGGNYSGDSDPGYGGVDRVNVQSRAIRV
ncbi:hypothetical protein B0H19DRAFT_692042 [Mycena capillaripes]|nr:hypothetical protein B0H19DRAFT_692042 [Mycena capillaripes]